MIEDISIVFLRLIWRQSVRKKVNKCLCRISAFYRSSHRRCSTKKVFFCNIHRKTPVLESLCGSSSLQFYQKQSPMLMFSCEYYEIFKDTYFEEHLRTTASYFMKKNGHSWRLNNSSKKIFKWIFSFVKWNAYKEKSKGNRCKSNQIPGRKLSRLTRRKFNFHM